MKKIARTYFNTLEEMNEWFFENIFIELISIQYAPLTSTDKKFYYIVFYLENIKS